MDSLINLAVAFRIGGLTVRWYGILISLSMTLAVILSCREARRQHRDDDFVISLALLILPAALVGARLYYVVGHWSYFSQHTNEIIAIWKGGSAIQGGLFLAILAALLYCRYKKEKFYPWADICILGVPLAQAIGRWGNYINGEAYGPIIQEGSFWSWVPFQVFADGAYHHPLFLYESLLNLAIFIFLYKKIRDPHRYGAIFCYYVILYSVIRFFLEYLRQDPLMIGPFRGAQLWSLAGVAVGFGLLYLLRKNPVVDVAAAPAVKGKKKKGKKGFGHAE